MAVQPPPGFTLVAPSGPTNPAVPPNAQPVAPQATPTAPPLPQGFQATKAPDFDPDSLLGRIGSRIGERVEKVERASEEYSAGEITYPELAMRGVAFAYGSLFDTVGEGVMSLLSALTPNEAENFLKEQLAAGGTALMDTETAQTALQLWNELPERAKDNIGDAFTIGTASLPKGISGKTGKKLSDSALASEKKSLARFVLPQNNQAKAARAAEQGLPVNARRVSNREDAILNTIISIPGVSGSSSRKKIMGALNKENARLSQQINASLGKQNITIPKAALNQRVTQGFSQFIQENPIYASKKFKGARTSVQEAYRVAVKDFDGSPTSLLKVRQKFDDAVDKLFAKDLYEGENIHREMVAVVRNQMNDLMESIAPDEQIRAMMRRQHHILSAKPTLAQSMAAQPQVVAKAARMVEQHPFLTFGALSGGGMFSNLTGSEALGVGLIGAAGAYGLTRPAVRQAAGAALQTLPVTRSVGTVAGSDLQEEVMGP